MKCDLCKKQDIHSKKSPLCEGCAEMVKRLLIVQQRIKSPESHITASAAA